jgi:hypothetical protein
MSRSVLCNAQNVQNRSLRHVPALDAMKFAHYVDLSMFYQPSGDWFGDLHREGLRAGAYGFEVEPLLSPLSGGLAF